MCYCSVVTEKQASPQTCPAYTYPPTCFPSSQPSSQPSGGPTVQPSRIPSSQHLLDNHPLHPRFVPLHSQPNSLHLNQLHSLDRNQLHSLCRNQLQIPLDIHPLLHLLYRLLLNQLQIQLDSLHHSRLLIGEWYCYWRY